MTRVNDDGGSPWVDAKDYASHYGISVKTIYRLISAGELEAEYKRFGKRIKLRRDYPLEAA